MPRHRRERVPLYRTRRSAVHAARRVPLSAAFEVPAPDAAEEPPPVLAVVSQPPLAPATGPAAVPPEAAEQLMAWSLLAELSRTELSKAELPRTECSTESSTTEAAEYAEASATVPLPAFRRRLLQISSPAGPIALGGASPAARAARRLMVTPWFAVAAGFVVAAGVWIYSPQASLQFPVGKGGEQTCLSPECKSTPQSSPGIAAGAVQLPITNGKSVGKVPTRVPRKMTYRLLGQTQGRFFMLITISGRRVPGTWRLKFALPGVEITGIEGARWQPSGSSSGAASWPVARVPWQTAGSTGGYQSGSSAWYIPGRSFVVVGAGVFQTPLNCSFNGRGCRFTAAPTTGVRGTSTWLQSH